MDCEYILVYTTGVGDGNNFTQKFHATTPEGAAEVAKEIIRHHQAKRVREMPFAPIVKGELYRQIQEFDGTGGLLQKDEDKDKRTNPSLVDRHMTP